MRLSGSFTPPGDKSISHRVALMSLLASGRCRVSGFAPGADCASSLQAVRGLGGGVEDMGSGELALTGAGGALLPSARIDCGNSGTTMRLLMGILAGAPGEYTLTGDDSLCVRPMERVAEPLRRMGADVLCSEGHAPVRIAGRRLHGAEHELSVASAQLKSALLLAGLNAQGPSTVREPHPSRRHTERMLAAWGADIAEQGGAVRVAPSRITLPEALRVPGDPSSAAFLLCAAAVLPGSRVRAEGVLLSPERTGFIAVLRRMGAAIEVSPAGEEPEPWGSVEVAFGPELRGCVVEPAEVPALVDEVPALALVASQARGETVLAGVGELRHKECDRLEAIATELGAMGASLRADGDALVISGPSRLRAAPRLDSRGDHRMAMTLRLAGLLAGGETIIAGEQCRAVSWPGFGAELARLAS